MGLEVFAEREDALCVAYSAGRAGTAGKGAFGGACAGILTALRRVALICNVNTSTNHEQAFVDKVDSETHL